MSADYDLKNNQKMAIHIAPATLDADASGGSIDTKDFGSLTFGIFVGAGGISFTGTNRVDFIVEETNDQSAINVAADDALILAPGAAAPGGTGIVRSLIATKSAADTTMTTVGYRGKKRYARVKADFGGTHGTGVMMAVVAQSGHPRVKPVGAIET